MNPSAPSAPPEPSQVLQWLATQAGPDHGEAPPLPEDLRKQLESTFGKAPAPIPARTEAARRWFSLPSLGLVVGLAAACFVALLVFHHEETPSATKPVLRGGNAAVKTTPGVAWQWDDASGFAAELESLGREGFTDQVANAATVIRFDTLSDAQSVLVHGSRNGVSLPEWSLRLPKLPADAQRPQRWLQALLQLQATIDATP